jgi:hypothetical protein
MADGKALLIEIFFGPIAQMVPIRQRRTGILGNDTKFLRNFVIPGISSTPDAAWQTGRPC